MDRLEKVSGCVCMGRGQRLGAVVGGLRSSRPGLRWTGWRKGRVQEWMGGLGLGIITGCCSHVPAHSSNKQRPRQIYRLEKIGSV